MDTDEVSTDGPLRSPAMINSIGYSKVFDPIFQFFIMKLVSLILNKKYKFESMA